MLDEFRRNIAQVATGAQINSREISARRKDGTRVDTLMSAGPIFRSDGTLQGLLAVFQDITETKRADAALKEKTVELATILEATPAAIIVRGVDGLITGWNPGAERLYGWTEAELLGKRPPLMLPGKEDEGRATTTRLLTGERITSMAAERMRKDGSLVDVLISATAMQDAAGKVRGLISVHQDVSEMRHAERRLQEATADLATIIDAAPVPVFVTDLNGIVTLWNRAAEQVYGWTALEVVGQRLPFTPPDRREEGRAFLKRLQAGERISGEIVRQQRKDGSPVEVSAAVSPMRDASGAIRSLVSIHVDITEQNKVAAQLRQAQRMEVVGQLTGGLAHDFNNLLGIIIGNLDLLQDELGSGHSATELVAAAMGACLRGAQLNKSLLAFSRQQDLEPQRVDVRASLENMAGLMRRTLGERVELVLEIAEDAHTIRVDPAQMEAAILNLAVNARDAMPDGGRLTIEASNRELDATYVADNPEAIPGNYVMIAVSDAGTGMSPETLARVFEPFFTTKEVGKGTGLGLSMVFGFVRQSGGHIKIYSEVGKGTTVRLYLPCDRTAELIDTIGKTKTAEEAHTPLTGTVLVVEDNDSLRRVAVRELGQLGFKVVEAENAQGALNLLDSGLRPDLLFTDVVMPGALDGAGLAEEALRRIPGLKILLTSGFTERATEGARRRNFQWPLLSKPYRKAELAAAIYRVMSDETAKAET